MPDLWNNLEPDWSGSGVRPLDRLPDQMPDASGASRPLDESGVTPDQMPDASGASRPLDESGVTPDQTPDARPPESGVTPDLWIGHQTPDLWKNLDRSPDQIPDQKVDCT